MEYVLDLDHSYFDISTSRRQASFVADPMNATGGSLVTVVNLSARAGVRPASVKFLQT
jgi:uracil phosphoribosyltransferase